MNQNKKLVVVESPTKARTIKDILGENYKVVSSMGHIIDLPSNKLGVDIEAGFVPSYRIIKGKSKKVKEIKKEAENVRGVYLATDPDREGEAIAWHIKNILEDKNRTRQFLRVIFHEITSQSIREAFSSPGELDMNKVYAQQARRILDRIVGYFLSPFLWKRICRGLSAGRVQSVALKFIVDREREIKRFKPVVYYYINIWFEKEGVKFKARLFKKGGKKIVFYDKEEVQRLKESLKDKMFQVTQIKKSVSKRKPYPPFITSSLQQEAFRRLRMSSARSMIIAQRLYEGVDLKKEGFTGLITYMRTDSFQVSSQAKEEARRFILANFSQEYLASGEYKFKKRGIIQAAHEAIRPTQIFREPRKLKAYLDKDEFSLYELIWKRFLASFMKEAEIENRQVIVSCGDLDFISTGVKLLFEGFLKIYPEKIKEEKLPDLEEKEMLKPIKIEIEEQTTKPPPRFNDASLVRLLEEKGIGRPSTYAPTISTLVSRNYVKRQKGGFVATELGITVIDLLKKFFPAILDETFTAKMEEQLDYVESGKVSWSKLLKDFYPLFKQDLDRAISLSEKKLEKTGLICEKCGREMVIRWSKKGKFLSCSGYPQCKNARSITTGVKCPSPGCSGELVERRNKRGQRFFGCSNFPKCRYTTSELPLS